MEVEVVRLNLQQSVNLSAPYISWLIDPPARWRWRALVLKPEDLFFFWISRCNIQFGDIADMCLTGRKFEALLFGGRFCGFGGGFFCLGQTPKRKKQTTINK